MVKNRDNSSTAGVYSTAEEVTRYPKVDPSVTDVATLTEGPSFAAVKRLKIWINAFIPRDVPGLTKPYPKDPNMTMLPGPTKYNDCFLTDQRSFSSDPKAKSRMHSEVELDITGDPKIVGESHKCYPTIEVNCVSGDEDCKETGIIRGNKFHNLWVSSDKSTSKIDLEVCASNPCFRGSPDIDCEGKITVRISPSKEIVGVDFEGLVDEFPAFEMYAAVDGEDPQSLFRVPPAPGKSPGDLFGWANIGLSGSVELRRSRSAVPL